MNFLSRGLAFAAKIDRPLFVDRHKIPYSLANTVYTIIGYRLETVLFLSACYMMHLPDHGYTAHPAVLHFCALCLTARLVRAYVAKRIHRSGLLNGAPPGFPVAASLQPVINAIFLGPRRFYVQRNKVRRVRDKPGIEVN